MSHKPISAAYIERKLRSILGGLGENPIPDFDDLKGLLVVENDRPEWSYAANERLLAGQNAVAAFVGELSWVGVAVPRNAGVLAVVEAFDFVTQPSNLFLRAIGDSSFDAMLSASATASLTPRDLRDDPLVVGSATRILAGHAGGGPGGLQFWVYQPTGNIARDKCSPFPIVLVPGTALVAVGNAVNVVVNSCSFAVRERPIEGKFEIK